MENENDYDIIVVFYRNRGSGFEDICRRVFCICRRKYSIFL